MKKFLTFIMALVFFTQTPNFNICLADIPRVPFDNKSYSTEENVTSDAQKSQEKNFDKKPNLAEENIISNAQAPKNGKRVHFDPIQVIQPITYENVYDRRGEEESNEHEEKEDEKDKICKFCLLI